MKMKLLSLMFVLVFSATADALDDCINLCNAANLSGDDLADCITGCSFRENKQSGGYYDGDTNGNMSGFACIGTGLVSGVEPTCDTNPFEQCTDCGQ